MNNNKKPLSNEQIHEKYAAVAAMIYRSARFADKVRADPKNMLNAVLADQHKLDPASFPWQTVDPIEDKQDVVAKIQQYDSIEEFQDKATNFLKEPAASPA